MMVANIKDNRLAVEISAVKTRRSVDGVVSGLQSVKPKLALRVCRKLAKVGPGTRVLFGNPSVRGSNAGNRLAAFRINHSTFSAEGRRTMSEANVYVGRLAALTDVDNSSLRGVIGIRIEGLWKVAARAAA